jgi:hypothetical protein
MGTFKKRNVVMLSTNEKATINSIVTHPSKYNVMGIVNVLTVDDPQPCIHQHLYIVSDDEVINRGDWYYDSILNKIDQCILHIGKHASCKKIIATTDQLLIKTYKPQFTIDKSVMKYYLPQPSKSFISKFVDEYNKYNVIDNVLVEYENGYIDDRGNYQLRWTLNIVNKPVSNIIKVDSKDNTITIKKVKDIFTREEVIELCENARDQGKRHGEILWNEWVNKNI